MAFTATLSGCTANWKVAASCDTTKKCEVHGEISGTLGGGGGSTQNLMASMLATSDTPDAAQIVIDISGSTVDYPATGTATISLINSATGQVQAAKLFPWVRSGSIIRLADPDAVNAWAAANGQNADKTTYKLTRFQSDYGFGEQTIAVASKFEGSVTATATSSFESCAPRGVYTRQICRQ